MIDGAGAWEKLVIGKGRFLHICVPFSQHELLIMGGEEAGFDISIFDARNDQIEKVGSSTFNFISEGNQAMMVL